MLMIACNPNTATGAGGAQGDCLFLFLLCSFDISSPNIPAPLITSSLGDAAGRSASDAYVQHADDSLQYQWAVAAGAGGAQSDACGWAHAQYHLIQCPHFCPQQVWPSGPGPQYLPQHGGGGQHMLDILQLYTGAVTLRSISLSTVGEAH